MELSDKVQAAFEEARTHGNYDLNLWGCNLDEVPEEVFKLTQLKSLNLSNNSISSVPDRIRELSSLKRLDLSGNPLEYVPDVPGLLLDWSSFIQCRESLSLEAILGIHIDTGDEQTDAKDVPKASLLVHQLLGFPNLRDLTVGLNSIIHSRPLNIPKPSQPIADLVESLGDFPKLENLSFFGVRLSEFPSGIRNLGQLKSLNLYGTDISAVPTWISELVGLSSFGVGMADLKQLPSSLRELRLNSLFLDNNRFTEIPEAVFGIPTLATLNLRCSELAGYTGLIKYIPAQVLELECLTSIDMKGHPIETPPPEVVKEGVEAIKSYWRQQQESGTDYLCEAKLLIVGEGGAGKTSLAKKIENPAYELRPTESSTEGIEVTAWTFKTGLHVKEHGREKLLERGFRTNMWDFGGQEVYHATHQFFLTRRSLYLLVADDRKEDTDFNYWLNVVELLSDGSPLLIVQNEKQNRRRDINLASLRARFPNLKEAYRVNLADNRGLSELVAAIRQELERLPHIGTPLPRTWNRVREALEKDTRNYIGVEEYLAICQQHGFTRREDKLQLSAYLHDLGICLHFQDDPVLKQTLILKPKWGTDAVYWVLDDRMVMDNLGRFEPGDLARIWSEDEYAAMRDELLRLMMKFQLCYELPEGGKYIAPQLLPPSQPAYEWNPIGNVVLQYEYEFMPKGLVTRFIVALNHLITDQGLVWKSGVVLEREGARAEVIEDYAKRKISVRVAGGDTRGLLAIVDDQLERIHRSFPTLKYEKYLPCNCPVCQKSIDPYAFPLSELKDFAKTGDHIQCRTSRKLVDAAALIRDLFPTAPSRLEIRFGEPRSPDPEPRKEVFVSYKWTDESKAVVDQLEKALSTGGIVLVRDRNEMKYKDSIRAFMERIGRGKCIVVVLSKGYLESKSCMFELTEIADRKEIGDRIFPIVLKDATVYDASGRLDYIAYWEEKIATLDAKMKTVSGANLEGIREELDLFAKIRATIAGIVQTLADMNALTPQQHQGSNFQELERALKVRLTEP